MSLLRLSVIDNGNTIIAVLKEALNSWNDWGLLKKPSLVKVFDDGHNHHTGLIKSDEKYYVLKVFEHSFNRTIATEHLMSELEISPRLYLAANNIALYEYIDDLGYAPSRLRDIANSLNLAHQSKTLNLGNFDLLGFCHSYLKSADSNTHAWHAALIPALKEFIEDPTPWVLCHNDLVTQNCLFDNEIVFFIDWEFAQRNNPWFDLAAIILYFDLSSSLTRSFLDSYQQGLNQTTENRIFYTSQIAVLWCDLLWSMHTMGNDYKYNNTDRFTQLRKLAQKLGINLPTKP